MRENHHTHLYFHGRVPPPWLRPVEAGEGGKAWARTSPARPSSTRRILCEFCGGCAIHGPSRTSAVAVVDRLTG